MTDDDGPAGDDLQQWAMLAGQPDAGSALSNEAARLYLHAFPDADLLEVDFGETTFLFDNFRSTDRREQRTVAAWRIVPSQVLERDSSRQAGFPLHHSLLRAGYERGHLIARASGGPLDINLYPQAWQVNRGRTPDGVEFRRLERLAARNPGCLQFCRLVWADQASVPSALHLLVAIDGLPVQQGVFDNVPTPRPNRLPTATRARMRAGTEFHRSVQADFLAGLVGADAVAERVVRLMDNSQGRVDLLVLPRMTERLALVVEIKSTDFDTKPSHRIRPNASAHVRQLQHYLDRIVDGIAEGDWDSASGVLLYPHRPRTAGYAELVMSTAERKALTVVWRDECDW